MQNIRIIFILSIICFRSFGLKAQERYFPPITGTTWDSLSIDSLHWCDEKVDSLYAFLEDHRTDGFIVLKNGKMVLEKYFGTFTIDSLHYWASCGKSLTAFLIGIAQENSFVDINNAVSSYLGSGWTSCSPGDENKIKLRHLLTMTSGLNENPGSGCTTDMSTPACLQYYSDTSSRWAYHTGAYRVLQDIIAASSGVSYNAFTNNAIETKTGMSGTWLSGMYYSKLRDMARFGLLMLNRGIWSNDTIMKDTTYYHNMIHPSQSFNLSYGYLWWLNGQPSFMLPFSPTTFGGSAIPNAPADMFAALGKNDQKIYIAPSQNLVVVRMGDAADTSALALSNFDNELWQKINELNCTGIGIEENELNDTKIFPVPFTTQLTIRAQDPYKSMRVVSIDGRLLFEGEFMPVINTSDWSPGMYVISLVRYDGGIQQKKVIKQP